MTPVAIVGWGAISALGEGPLAVRAGATGAPARTAIARDEELARAGLARPFAARVRGPALEDAGDDDAFALLERALAGCIADLDVRRPAWRSERVGVVLGTSSGAMRAAVALFASPHTAASQGANATYYAPVARAVQSLGIEVDPCVVVLGACASASLAIGLGARWLERGEGGARPGCDLVLAGGFDALTVFVAAGFEVLRATTATPPPRPFRSGRDGMALGDGAAVVALARASHREGARSPHAYVLGFGASSDAVHLTAPDREGAGLARAARSALDDAGNPSVDFVSAHATATPFNDAAEFRALERALGAERARTVPIHAFKASIGHTLGAGGALELLASLDALDRGVLPATAGPAEDAGTLDPDTPVRVLARSAPAPVATALKLSSAFGGVNAALVIGAPKALSAISDDDGLRASPRPRAPAWLQGGVHVERIPSLESLAARTRLPIDRVGRGDDLVLLALAAVAELEAQCGPLEGAGVVIGTALATLETNALFAARLRERGPLAAEPRRFPYTSPNAVAGECSIAFGLTGPCFSVGAGLYAGLEALACAAVLVESGDAARMIAVAVDQSGPMTRAVAGDALGSGAVAFLLTSPAAVSRATPRARIGAITLRRGSANREAHPSFPARGVIDGPGRRALIPLAESVDDPRLPEAVECNAPPAARARIEFEPVRPV